MADKSNKVVISCAITGSIHTPTMSDALPITPDQIAEQSIAAAQAGAAILHLHARDPKDGRPSRDPAVFMQFLPRIKQNCDVDHQHHHRRRRDHDGRAAHCGRHPVVAGNVLAQHGLDELRPLSDGARASRPGSTTGRSRTSRSPTATSSPTRSATSRRSTATLGEGHGVKFEHECYDTGHLYNLAHCIDKGLFKPPVFLQLIFGILGGIGPDLDNLLFMKRTADRLFGDDYLWSVLAGGRHQMNFCTMATMLGGNVRVGLEDSLYIGPGKLAASNAEQVAKIRRIVEELGFQIATPQEARETLGLKGADRVKF